MRDEITIRPGVKNSDKDNKLLGQCSSDDLGYIYFFFKLSSQEPYFLQTAEPIKDGIAEKSALASEFEIRQIGLKLNKIMYCETENASLEVFVEIK